MKHIMMSLILLNLIQPLEKCRLMIISKKEALITVEVKE
jgi:hypothetical protein